MLGMTSLNNGLSPAAAQNQSSKVQLQPAPGDQTTLQRIHQGLLVELHEGQTIAERLERALAKLRGEAPTEARINASNEPAMPGAIGAFAAIRAGLNAVHARAHELLNELEQHL